jgi:hypothetical protein
VFEAALTGRAVLEGAADPIDKGEGLVNARSLLDAGPQSEAELDAIRAAVVEQEGLLLSIFDVLRRVPRRVLMVFKLNDLTRSLDHALHTTHASVRVFLVTARYCALAAWRDDQRRVGAEMRRRGYISPGMLWDWVSCWWWVEFCLVAWFRILILPPGSSRRPTGRSAPSSCIWTQWAAPSSSAHGCAGSGRRVSAGREQQRPDSTWSETKQTLCALLADATICYCTISYHRRVLFHFFLDAFLKAESMTSMFDLNASHWCESALCK